MPKIKCWVKKCTYNNKETCTKRNIDVESSDSLIKDETYCESFVPQNESNLKYEFASFDNDINRNVDVYCNAVNCVYEKNQRCYADHIQIRNSNIKYKYDTEFASDIDEVEKENPKVCKDTKCSTFEPVE